MTKFSIPILDRLEHLYAARQEEIERWLGQRRAEAPPHLTTSVDLRHSGVRCVPVDTNLYPAGFNNLSAAARLRASRFIKRFLEERLPEARRAIIIPENHTRNLPYLDSVSVLQQILTQAGVQSVIGGLSASPGTPVELLSAQGKAIEEVPLRRAGPWLETQDGFRPDFVLLNNDCSTGVPEILEQIAQPILPPPTLGWHIRRKSVHFEAYCALAEAFGQAF
ncbi:MAG: glutamate--cysteine ligase, partial [Alphaproteobacteria bacterium]|nr:glutamate--cysteine ligase [Alphaproteobacteria bacterium]